MIQHRRKNDINVSDIVKAIDSVSELKCGFQVIKTGNTLAVMTIPMQLSNDSETIIKLANDVSPNYYLLPYYLTNFKRIME